MQSQTIPALLYERYSKTPDGIAHYSLDPQGKWQPHSWKDYYGDVCRLAKGLMDLGLTTGQNIGIMAPAFRQWDIVQMAILSCGGVVVGLDPHDAAENINNIARRTDLSGLIVGDITLLKKIDERLRDTLEFIVCLDMGTDQADLNQKVIPVSEIMSENLPESTEPLTPVTENDPATIIFTSGTTGTPKGIQYTHGQVVIACNSILKAFNDIQEESNLVCWLPLSNLYQRIINYCAVVVGAATYYVENPRNVLQHMQEINPHVFLGVPRFYEKLHAGIMENIDKKPVLLRKTAHWALQKGLRYKKLLWQKKTPGFTTKISYQLADTLVLKHFRNLMGRNLRYMISGSAPISQWLQEQFDAIGFLILEAYGISENIIPIAANRSDSFKFGTVGKPLPGNEVKLAEDGELLVKGPGVFNGYFKDDERQSPLTEDGFLATGDLAKFDSEGFLLLTGRKSEIFKTSTGRRISPVKIEVLINRVAYVEHALIFGAGKPFLVAILSIDPSKLRQRVRQVDTAAKQDLRNTPDEWQEFIQNDVRREVSDLQSYLQPAGLIITDKPFTIENGELTANLKVRRKVIMEKYEKEIADLYTAIQQKQQNQASRKGSPSRSRIVVRSL